MRLTNIAPTVVLLLVILLPGQLHGQADQQEAEARSLAQQSIPKWPGQVVDWNGFSKHVFQFGDRAAYVVSPKQTAPGNPWVFRARFPDFHAEADRILLDRGFHIARIDTDGLLGCDEAMQAWDGFYQFVVERGLANKCALEGVSRGGLFVYGFASRWPDRVACLYADTPVCDLRSWPGGKGAGKGSPDVWKRCLNLYQLTEQTAATFKGNPIDRVQPIVNAGIPLLHIVSLNDQIVPPSENTFLLRDRINQLGGKLTVIEVPEGTERSSGHHFEHPDPVRVADFIERHAAVLPANINGRPAPPYQQLRVSLRPVAERFRKSKRGRVAFVGGSITTMSGWRDQTMEYLQQRFPETEFEFIAAGIPSTGSVPGAFRLTHDVLSKGPVDLLFEEASVNDLTNGRSEVEMIRGMEGIVRQALQSNPDMGIVMMHFVCPQHRQDYRQRTVPATIVQHEQVASHYRVSTLDLAAEVTARIDAEQFDWQQDFRDLHPSPYGHRVYAAAIRRLLSEAFEASSEELLVETKLLPKRLDPFSYDAARFVSPQEAADLKSFQWLENVDPRIDGVGGGVRPGFVNVPMLVADQPNASFEFSFQGRAVGLWVAAGPDAGAIGYRIDNGPWQRKDLFTRWSKQLHLPWVYVLADELDGAVEHRLTVKVSQQNNPESRGHACRIVRLLVNGSAKRIEVP